MGFSPLHASTVGLIRNPKTNRLSPQFYCVYDDNFDTVHSIDPDRPPPIWEDLIVNHRFRNDLEPGVEVEDNWERPNFPTASTGQQPSAANTQQGQPTARTEPSSPGDCTPSPAEDYHEPDTDVQTPAPTLDQSNEDTTPPTDAGDVEPATAPVPQPRMSGRIRKPVDHFKFTNANGYNSIKYYVQAHQNNVPLWGNFKPS